jgi:type IV pilus assembly protein PilV
MLEVLVALLILMVGLLGLAGLLVQTQQGEVEAYQRKQAAVLLQDMADRLRANPVAAGNSGQCYAFTKDADTGLPALGTGNAVDATFTCGAGSADQQARGRADLKAWNNALLGTSEQKGTANVGGLIDARGCLTNPSTGEYVISVAWQGLQPTVPPPATLTCGVGLYSHENLRRVVSIKVRLANLAP